MLVFFQFVPDPFGHRALLISNAKLKQLGATKFGLDMCAEKETTFCRYDKKGNKLISTNLTRRPKHDMKNQRSYFRPAQKHNSKLNEIFHMSFVSLSKKYRLHGLESCKILSNKSARNIASLIVVMKMKLN